MLTESLRSLPTYSVLKDSVSLCHSNSASSVKSVIPPIPICKPVKVSDTSCPAPPLVGFSVGCTGSLVGFLVGFAVGIGVGLRVGLLVGLAVVGLPVGSPGVTVGLSVGPAVGVLVVGFPVGL